MPASQKLQQKATFAAAYPSQGPTFTFEGFMVK